ncbi:MAG: anthranilate synthase component I [Herpetosiphonaceae bacterium]|nr:MAG: anthranilate synthase component I [Herpetosiphonaceae bacterium]
MHIRPSLDELQTMVATHGERPYPIVCELLADMETPVSAYLKIARSPYSFLLESVEGGERIGRYSFIGAEPRAIIRMQGEYSAIEIGGRQHEWKRRHGLDALASLAGGFPALPGGLLYPGLRLPRFTGGAVGYLSYETARSFERLPAPDGDAYGMPDGIWMVVDTLLAFDHLRHTIVVISNVMPGEELLATRYRRAVERIERLVEQLHAPLPGEVAPSLPLNAPQAAGSADAVASNMTREQYMAAVERAIEYIRAGDIFQVVLSQRFSRRTQAEPFALYRALRVVNPSPYMYYLAMPEGHLIGASPEMLVRVENGLVETHPIAGTRRRGRDEVDERRMAAELLGDEKERAEHLMLVDLGRNDIGRVARAGSVQVPRFMDVERYSHVMHLVSHVTGELREDLTALDALRACFPAGTVSGAPKLRAMEIIAELEPDQRGPYAGCVGYLGFDGNLDTAITIRTIALRNGVAYVQAGAGIVADSHPRLEYLETQNKARALLAAVDLAEGL